MKKSDTITSNAPIIDISIECAPRIEDKGLVMQAGIGRQPTYKYSPEFIALEEFVEDATAPLVRRTPHELLSEEIIRVVRTLPEKCFIPTKRKGVAVSCWFTLPVNIHMQ